MKQFLILFLVLVFSTNISLAATNACGVKPIKDETGRIAAPGQHKKDSCYDLLQGSKVWEKCAGAPGGDTAQYDCCVASCINICGEITTGDIVLTCQNACMCFTDEGTVDVTAETGNLIDLIEELGL